MSDCISYLHFLIWPSNIQHPRSLWIHQKLTHNSKFTYNSKLTHNKKSPKIQNSPVIQNLPINPNSPIIQYSPIIQKYPIVQKSPIIQKSPTIQYSFNGKLDFFHCEIGLVSMWNWICSNMKLDLLNFKIKFGPMWI